LASARRFPDARPAMYPTERSTQTPTTTSSTNSHVCESPSEPIERAADKFPTSDGTLGGALGGNGGGGEGGGGEGGGGDGASKAKDSTLTSETPPTETPSAAESVSMPLVVKRAAPTSASAMVGRITSAVTRTEAAEMVSWTSLGVTPSNWAARAALKAVSSKEAASAAMMNLAMITGLYSPPG